MGDLDCENIKCLVPIYATLEGRDGEKYAKTGLTKTGLHASLNLQPTLMSLAKLICPSEDIS